jgi:hypothetical protein
MQRALLVLVALAWFPGGAAAQQPCTADARHVVNELYRHMLERPAAESASAHWVEQLERGRMTVRDVVRDIAMSPEYQQRFIYTESGENTPYERSVARLYRHVLGRQPDAGGQQNFARTMQQSGPRAVIDQILDSREYNEQFGDWGVPGSGGVRFCATNASSRSSQPYGTYSDRPSDQSFTFPPRYGVMDRNRDGVLTWNEWRGSRRTFAQHDVDGDGRVTAREVAELSGAATSGDLVRLDARDQWTDTGIVVRAGDDLLFDSTGTIQLSAGDRDVASPAGAYTGRGAAQAPIPSAPAGALIARIGNGRPFAVGDQRSIRAPGSGRLYLGINDDYLGDNSGEFRVTVTAR